MTILHFQPLCKKSDCMHNYNDIYINTSFNICSYQLNIILNNLSQHYNFHYVISIIDLLGYYDCDFQVSISFHSIKDNIIFNKNIDYILKKMLI
jgi:hypothetical protein